MKTIPVVIKYGGHAMTVPELSRAFARDLTELARGGRSFIVVHGGGPQISSLLKRLNIESRFEQGLRHDLDYIAKDPEANAALNRIRLITMVQPGAKFDYSRLPELNELMAKVKASHDAMLEEKREELLEIVRQCMADIHQAAGEDPTARSISSTADTFYTQKKQQIAETQELALLDGLIPPMWQYKDTTLEKIEVIVNPPKRETPPHLYASSAHS